MMLWDEMLVPSGGSIDGDVEDNGDGEILIDVLFWIDVLSGKKYVGGENMVSIERMC